MKSFDQHDDEDRLKEENEFLKMKLMLEHGASFGGNEDMELPADVENEFLNNIAAFEKQFGERKMIKVFDKIGRPGHFKPVKDIPDNEIDHAWTELRDYLNEYHIDLDACSPNISTRELYRFTTDELFDHETDDIDLPGWSTNFIYDEFYPDPVYDNTRLATDNCISIILGKEPMEWTHNFKKENLRLNQHFPLAIEEFKNKINRFKEAYDDLEINELATTNCIVNSNKCEVTGIYSLTATLPSLKATAGKASGKETFELSGKWKSNIELDKEFGYWYIVGVVIEGIDF